MIKESNHKNTPIKLTLVGIMSIMMVSACSQAPKENTVVAVDASQTAANTSAQAKSTFARFVPERKDDFAWENDMVAFRAYGPALRDSAENAGVDCWLKRVDYPIINKWYQEHLEQDKSYHVDHGEGLDNYHVGSSAGCGSTSLWLDGKREPLETYTKWEIKEQSPAKTVFELSYEHEINGSVYGEVKQVSIELGNRLYQVSSRFTKNGEVAAGLPVTVGLTTHDEKAAVESNTSLGWLMTWETLGDHDLGTAVMVEPSRIEQIVTIESEGVKDAGHALIILNTDKNGQIQYQAGYGWEAAGTITTPAEWAAYLSAKSVN